MKVAEQAAQALSDAGYFRFDQHDDADYQAVVLKTAAEIITAECEPVMDVLREALRRGRRLCEHHTNVETGNYLVCLICDGESPGGRTVFAEIVHTPDCWLSHAREIVGEE